ncbi:MAG: hypothetical protein A2W31_00610, partial [Planctomycetes bacterium RBG_16_64_10]
MTDRTAAQSAYNAVPPSRRPVPVAISAFTSPRQPPAHRKPQAVSGLLLLGLASMIVAPGCTRLDLTTNLPWRGRDAQPQIPARMTTIWTDTVLTQPPNPAIRGLGGRLMFYKKDKEQPVRVDGTLTVYAYDDTEQVADSRVPARKYVFPNQHLANHYSESALGPSYSFWLPWDEVGNPQRKLSLIARFEAKSGEVVVSEMAHQLLPGPVAKPARPATENEGTVSATHGGQLTGSDEGATGGTHRQVSYETPVEKDASKVALETTTITVPPAFLVGPGTGANPQTGNRAGAASGAADGGSPGTAATPAASDAPTASSPS